MGTWGHRGDKGFGDTRRDTGGSRQGRWWHLLWGQWGFEGVGDSHCPAVLGVRGVGDSGFGSWGIWGPWGHGDGDEDTGTGGG